MHILDINIAHSYDLVLEHEIFRKSHWNTRVILSNDIVYWIIGNFEVYDR